MLPKQTSRISIYRRYVDRSLIAMPKRSTALARRSRPYGCSLNDFHHSRIGRRATCAAAMSLAGDASCVFSIGCRCPPWHWWRPLIVPGHSRQPRPIRGVAISPLKLRIWRRVPVEKKLSRRIQGGSSAISISACSACAGSRHHQSAAGDNPGRRSCAPAAIEKPDGGIAFCSMLTRPVLRSSRSGTAALVPSCGLHQDAGRTPLATVA